MERWLKELGVELPPTAPGQERSVRELATLADHEMMTLDGVDGFYWGHVTLDGREAKLARELSDRDYLPPAVSSKRKSFAGAIFQVLSGAGAGQWFRVRCCRAARLTCDVCLM